MTQGLLFIPKVWNDGDIGVDKKYRVAIAGAESLAHQLRKLQRAPTKNYHTYFMPGDETLVENKKDLWAAFIYAAKQARAHIIRHRNLETVPVEAIAVKAVVNSNRGKNGIATGSKKL